MANHILFVEQIEKDMRLGWPEGTTDLYKRVPHLLARIRELENALTPFARVAARENSVTGGTGQAPEMQHVYTKDCQSALSVMDRGQAIQQTRDDFFAMPVEG